MVVYNNITRNDNIQINNLNMPGGGGPAPAWKAELLILVDRCVDRLPVKELNRRLREFFMLNISNLKTIPPDFEEYMLDVMSILNLLDQAEDAQC